MSDALLSPAEVDEIEARGTSPGPENVSASCTGQCSDIPRLIATIRGLRQRIECAEISKGPTGYPRWLEDEIIECQKARSGCDYESLCNAHHAKALAALEEPK
jgi:hypothetical protein